MNPICPECLQAKHVNCTQWTIDDDDDSVDVCHCENEVHPWNH